MSQQMFFAVVTVGVVAVVHLPCVDVHAVLAVFGKGDAECDEIVADAMRHVFAQLFFFYSVLVQSCHEIC